MTDDPVLAGSLASDPRALEFARVVQTVHARYAREVVMAFGLCPFLHDPATAFGRFCVVLEEDARVDLATELVLDAPGVVHLVYPLYRRGCHEMERFGNELHERVRRASFERGDSRPPVHATFHPDMEGDLSSPRRRVGFVRRAPDPFVQFVPQGLTDGGSTFIDPSKLDLASLLGSPAKKLSRLASLDSTELESLRERVADVRRERDERYAGYFDAS